jgi:uncharacterized damage-inducible protein DinB
VTSQPRFLSFKDHPVSDSTKTNPLIDRYASGAAILAYAVSGLTREQEHAPPGAGAGAWTIAELAAHLADADLVLADRMKRVIAEDNPPLVAFDEKLWAERLGYPQCSVEEAVNLLAANRHWTTRMLRQCGEADFARAGIHSETGRKTLAELLSTATNHLDHHLRFLYQKRANLGAALTPRYCSEQLGNAVSG